MICEVTLIYGSTTDQRAELCIPSDISLLLLLRLQRVS